MRSDLDRACERHGITLTADYSDKPIPRGFVHGSTAWKVTLKMGRRRLTTDFYTGPAWSREPSAADVLSCLLSDASSYRNARHFGEWANDLGFDDDSRKAEETYRACGKIAKRLDRFFAGQEATRKALESADH